MKIYVFIILVSFQLFGQSNSFNVECNFNANWDYMILRKIYRCELENNLAITSPDSTAITSVTGHHWSWKSNDDVVGFDSRHKTMLYFPKRLDNFFENLKSIVIYNGRMKEIHQSDLKHFPKLVNFYLDNNEIEILEAGLFDFNPNLEGISFLGNKLVKIHIETFNNLPKLQNIWFSKNLCISMDATESVSGVKNVIKQAKTLCPADYTEQEPKASIDSCDSNHEIVNSLTAGFKSIETRIDDLQATIEEQKSLESGKCQISFNDRVENLEERFESFENRTVNQLENIEEELKTNQSLVLNSIDEKIKEAENRLVEKIEKMLDEKLKKIFDALNVTN